MCAMCKERKGSLRFCTESRVSRWTREDPRQEPFSDTGCGGGGGQGTVPSCSREKGRTKEGAPSLHPQGEAVPPLGPQGGQGGAIC